MKELKSKVWIFIVILIIIILGVLFLFNSKQDSYKETDNLQETEIIEQKKSIERASDLALTLSDLSEGWEISTRGERTLSDVSKYGLDLGWKEGYSITFRKIESKDIQVTQSVSIYPEENMHLVLNSIKDELKTFKESVNGTKINYRVDDFDNRYRFEELPKPSVGDDSVAYKLIYLDTSEVAYYIEFIKSNYYEHISGYDYELVNELAKKAEDKII